MILKWLSFIFFNSGIDSATKVADIGSAASHILDNGGLARVSFAQKAFNGNLEAKVVIGAYNDNLLAIQGKLPRIGSEFTNTIANDLNIDRQGFKKDNLNISYRAGIDLGTGNLSTNTIIEADYSKGNFSKLGNIGDLKYSYGIRSTNGRVVPAVNIGLEAPFGFSINAEFRGK